MIQYCVTENPEFVNLAFGDKKMNDDGSYYIDDRIDSNNGDRDKVLATVAMSVYQYTSVYSNKFIVFAGSTDARTRLYRMAIAANFDELNSDYEIFGIVTSKNGIIFG